MVLSQLGWIVINLGKMIMPGLGPIPRPDSSAIFYFYFFWWEIARYLSLPYVPQAHLTVPDI